ncbi:MAG: hypothetical protein LBR25_09025 [Erysipelotrichaceae bacterium]|jgi:hypothetical protein|nr:hypothetical protein [Erysipelotrichaceae bacterium]
MRIIRVRKDEVKYFGKYHTWYYIVLVLCDYVGAKKMIINTEPFEGGKILSTKIEAAAYTDIQYDGFKTDEYDREKRDRYQVEFEKAFIRDALEKNELWLVPFRLKINTNNRLSVEFLNTRERVDRIYAMGGRLEIDQEALRSNPEFFKTHPKIVEIMDYINAKNKEY